MVECKRRRMLCLLGAVCHTSSVDDVLDDVVDGSKATDTAQPKPKQGTKTEKNMKEKWRTEMKRTKTERQTHVTDEYTQQFIYEILGRKKRN